MDRSFFPGDLLAKCRVIVLRTHKKHGLGDLPRKLATKECAVALASFPDMLILMGIPRSALRFRALCWVVGAASAALMYALSAWFLVGVALGSLGDRFLQAQVRSISETLAAVMLATDVLASDFAGWGAAFPQERQTATEIFGPATPPGIWVDYYLPSKQLIAPAVLATFGPT